MPILSFFLPVIHASASNWIFHGRLNSIRRRPKTANKQDAGINITHTRTCAAVEEEGEEEEEEEKTSSALFHFCNRRI
jgi:hypothetical protein